VLYGVLLFVWLICIAFALRAPGAQTPRNRQLRPITAEAIEPAQL
jgi:hypothetical protein